MLIPNKFSGYTRDGIRRVYKKDAAAPDPAIGQASLRQIEMAEKQWDEYIKDGGDRDWLRGVTNEALAIQRQTADKSAEATDYQLGIAKRNDDRYWNNTVPYQDMVDADIEELYSQAGIDRQVNDATADVNAAMANARAQSQRGLTRMGVNPNSGAFAGAENAMSLNQATAMAAAANKTRMAAQQAGLASKFQSLGAKLGMAGLGATNAGLATSAMGTGLSAANGMTGAAASNIGTNNSTFGSSMSGMSAGINSGIGLYNAQANAQAQANNASGEMFGSLLGAGAQLGAAAIKFSDKRLKENIQLVGVDEATGLNLYTFSYKGGDKRFIGVMADEVEIAYPEAVFTMPDGFKAVNYATLGLEMVEVKE